MISGRWAIVLLSITTAFTADPGVWLATRIVSIEYPLLGLQSRTEGSVIAKCTIGDDGSITTARITSGPLLLGNAVLSRLPGWRFKSRTQMAGAGKQSLNLTFIFRLDDSVRGPGTVFIFESPYTSIITASAPYRTH